MSSSSQHQSSQTTNSNQQSSEDHNSHQNQGNDSHPSQSHNNHSNTATLGVSNSNPPPQVQNELQPNIPILQHVEQENLILATLVGIKENTSTLIDLSEKTYVLSEKTALLSEKTALLSEKTYELSKELAEISKDNREFLKQLLIRQEAIERTTPPCICMIQ